MPFPLSPHHVQLIAACYPPSSALVTAGPEYKPNSQELSRLVYYATNRPGKLAKLSSELNKRVNADVGRTRSGNARARASLLISLNILKALAIECRRDLSLFSTPLMAALNTCLGAFPRDLEVMAKVASVFTAWATYTNGQLLGVDQNLTRDYVSALSRFAAMCSIEARNNDVEDRNRTRLIGLRALTASVASEALYNSSSQFKSQVSVIVPAFLGNILESDFSKMEHGLEEGSNYLLPLSPYLSDFRSRPLLERRAASIHAHIDGDEGPTLWEITKVSLKALACLFNQSNGSQVGHVTRALFDSLGLRNGWKNTEHCCWLAQKSVEWTRYQYRFTIPVRLVERLVEARDDSIPSDLHKTLAKMLKSVLAAPTPLVNLSTSDICSSLTALVLRRIAINPHDELLPALVECIGSLGTHIYYADQIHDLACEIIGRLVAIETHGLTLKGQFPERRHEERAMALRCLIAALGLLIRTSSGFTKIPQDGTANDGQAKFTVPAASSNTGRAASPIGSDSHSVRDAFPQRARISTDVWQETLSLLCDEDVSVRLEYAKALTLFIRTELRPQNDFPRFVEEGTPHADSSKQETSSDDNPLRRIRSRTITVGDGSTDRFVHALLACLFVLATTSTLDTQSSYLPSPSHSIDIDREHIQVTESVHVNITPSTPLQSQTFSPEHDLVDASQGSPSSRRKSLSLSHSRKFHRIRWLLDASNQKLQPPHVSTSSPCLSDYSHILAVLDALHEQIPPKALLMGFPMLSALRTWCASECSCPKRRVATREVLIRHSKAIGDIWSCHPLQSTFEKVQVNDLFLYPIQVDAFLASEDPQAIDQLPALTGGFDWPCGTSDMITALATHRTIQHATGLTEEALRKRLDAVWKPDNALRDSTEESSPGSASSRLEHGNPLLKISPALMHISNLSLQSLARSNRAVGVNDLRDALEGRAGSSSVALGQGKAPSVASLGGTYTSGASGESAAGYGNMLAVPRMKTHALNGENRLEVREMLDKLGIGARNRSPPKERSSERPLAKAKSVLVPPYNS